MNIYCIEGFKSEYERLIKKRSYRSLEEDIIQHFLFGEDEKIITGIRLNHSEHKPYIKKRLDGAGGFRVYFYAIIHNECVYLMYVHPKSGSLGSDNITDTHKSKIFKDVLSCIQDNDLYLLKHEDGKIKFIKVQQHK